MKVRVAALLLLLTLLGQFITAAMPSTATAQATNPFKGIPITGTVGTGTFTGTLDIVNFAVQHGQLVANAVLSGTAKDAAGTTVGTLTNAPVALPLAQQASSGGCSILHLELGPLDLNLLGLRVQLNRVILDITAQPGPGNLLGNLLCSIANLLNPGGLTGNLSTLASLLNGVLSAFNQGTPAAGNPLQGIPISGALGNAAFSGLLNLTSFVNTAGALVANGTVTGALSNAGTVSPITALPVTGIPVAVSGASGAGAQAAACQILHLVLGPINLNLLGLVITTNQIVLDITAQPGPGNLLGNLLCAITGLLDPSNLATLTNLLNGLLAMLNLVQGGALNPFGAIPVTGAVPGGGGALQGLLSIASFAVNQAGQLVANGTLTGLATGAAGQPLGVATQQVQVPVAHQAGGTAQMAATCQILHLVLGPINLNLLGLVITTNQIVLDITAESGPGNLLGNLLCAIANLLNPGGPLAALADLLNSLIAAFNSPLTTIVNPFVGIPVTGTATGAGGAQASATSTFAGIFNIGSFAVEGGRLVARGTLGGILSDTNGVSRVAVPQDVAMPVITQAASGEAQTSATCQILHLVLGPINLDLLGLKITTNQIVLDITAQSGPGNLLGNLLCAIANLLNPGGTLSGLATVLNSLLNAFNSTLGSANPFRGIPVTSTTPAFNGVLNITRFAVQNGQLVALGNLVGTLVGANGVSHAINQPVTLPVNATGTTGTCQILHLDLGPINLNLLGLQITTNRIVLDITAQSGPGNLLGNLLCAIANLLNPGGDLPTLASLLNFLVDLFNRLFPTAGSRIFLPIVMRGQ